MKPSSRLILGILFVAISIITLVQAVRLVQPIPVVMDFPCSGDEDARSTGMNANTRLAYCLSLWPFNMGGGGIYSVGTSEQDEARIPGLRFRRDGETLYVNNRPVEINGRYETVDWNWTTSKNPWLILTNRFEIRNRGLIAASANGAADVLFVSGDVHQGWIPNPLGLIMLIAGMVLFLREARA